MSIRIRSILIALPLFTLLTACGGGGGGSSSPAEVSDSEIETNVEVVSAASSSLTLPTQLEVVTNEN